MTNNVINIIVKKAFLGRRVKFREHLLHTNMKIVEVDLTGEVVKVYLGPKFSSQTDTKSIDNCIYEKDVILRLTIPKNIKPLYSVKSTLGWINNFKTLNLIQSQDMCLRLHIGEILSLEREKGEYIHLFNQPKKDKKFGYLRCIGSTKPLAGSIREELENLRKDVTPIIKEPYRKTIFIKGYQPGDWSPTEALMA